MVKHCIFFLKSHASHRPRDYRYSTHNVKKVALDRAHLRKMIHVANPK